MTAYPPSLAGAAWLGAPAVRQIFAALTSGGEQARIVGGAVRNALMGLPVAECDFGTTAPPNKVAALAEAAGLKVVPTGVEHGTLTLVSRGHGYQVTTLREDIATDGRRAVVRYGRDWEADARRRDFTVNALSVDADGAVYDPIGGYEDVLARRIRFIGDADQRIAEDRLRILRFFRFHAEYARGDPDAEGLVAVMRARHGLRDLSAERVGQEMRRLVVAVRAPETVELMQEAGILPITLAGIAYLAPFARLAAFEAGVGMAAAAPLRLAALACRIEEDALRISDKLRLANAERDRILTALAAASAVTPFAPAHQARRALYRLGAGVYRDGVALAFAWIGGVLDDRRWGDLATLPDRWPAPVFPLSGRDVVAGGSPPGPAVGDLLRAVEAWWIERDFAPDEAALRRRLRQMIAAGH